MENVSNALSAKIYTIFVNRVLVLNEKTRL